MLQIQITLLVLAAVLFQIHAKGYEGYKVFEVLSETQEQCDFLYELSKMEKFYDFFALKRIPNNLARVMVNPNEEEYFLNVLTQHKVSYRVVSDDVGRALEQEFKLNKLGRNLFPFTGQGRLSTERYYSHGEINAYIDNLAQRYPSRVFVRKVGNSYEGRDIKTITITNGDSRGQKNVIFIDGGFHAREWISPAAVLYVIDQLVENYNENSELLLDYDWVILPLVNPDGYEYSQLKINTRLWRKTRQPYVYEGEICYGADPNRNFDFHWNEDGSSKAPCNDIYAGPKGFSEPETVIVRDLMHSFKRRGIMYLTVHSFGKYLLYPWGWTNDLPDTWKDLDEVARTGADAIFNVTGTQYKVGSTTNVLYMASGASDDYAFSIGFKISMTMELLGGGIFGFNPPVTSIESFVKEAWIGIRAMAVKVIEKYPTEAVRYL